MKLGNWSVRETQRTEQNHLVQPQNTRFAKLELAPDSSNLMPERMLHQGELMRISRHQKEIEANILVKGHRSDDLRDAIPVSQPRSGVGSGNSRSEFPDPRRA
jgi:hypothetical protein